MIHNIPEFDAIYAIGWLIYYSKLFYASSGYYPVKMNYLGLTQEKNLGRGDWTNVKFWWM